LRWSAASLLVTFAVPFIALARTEAKPAPPVPTVPATSPLQKVVMLAGAAALDWLYRQHQNAKGDGPNGRYYRSKDGRVYYHDPRTYRVIWVTSPPASQPMVVLADEYARVMGQPPPGPVQEGAASRVITARPSAPVDAAPTTRAPGGNNNRKKMVLLAGDAALDWLYRRHQDRLGEGADGRYYRSKDGRIYYHDRRTYRVIWLTPPPITQPLAVPADEYQRVMGRLPPGFTADGGSKTVITQPPAPQGPPRPSP
jgi:hypothetical protein